MERDCADKDSDMDIHSVSFKVAVEAAGIWPAVIELSPTKALYVLCYRRSDGEHRILTVEGSTLAFNSIDVLNLFVLGPHTGTSEEVHLALEVLSSLSPEGMVPELFPRNPVEQSLFWIAGGRMLASEGQAQRLLDTLGFLNDWHDSLAESGAIDRWPAALDEAGEILIDLLLTRQVTTDEAAEELRSRNLKPVLAREVGELLARCA